jgi:hypothetical protein
MNQDQQALEIRLNDGRTIIAVPGPEDQQYLGQVGSETTITLGSSDFDTAAHGMSSDIELDVSGHAMTLRLPTAADAEALRRLLMVSALSATIVAAGAIAALQPSSIPSTSTAVHRGPAPAPMADFQVRREQDINEMLEAPPAVGQPSDVDTQDAVHGAPAIGSGSISSSQVAPAPALRPGAPSAGFQDQREQAADDLLQAPAGESGAPSDSGTTHGGPQD